MKIRMIITAAVLSSFFLFEACKESSTTQPPLDIEVDESYFPALTGSYYRYLVVVTDSLGFQVTGTRSSFYNGETVIANTSYIIQIDTTETSAETTINFSYFRTTDSGVFYYLDTTGFAELIPSDLLQGTTIDTEIRLLFIPMFSNTSWVVFKININVPPLSFNPVEVTAVFETKEVINVEPLFINQEAVKIKFNLAVRNPTGPSLNYEAYGWLVQNVGFVKWEGNSTLVSAFTGGGIDFADTTSVVTQSLIEFAIPE
jgi:hypothetical protein